MSEPSNNNRRLVVTVGNEYFEHGLTRLELSEDGQVLIVNRQDKDEKQIDNRVDPTYATRLLEQAQSEIIGKPQLGERRGLPDEPRYSIEIYRGISLIGSRHVWRSELVQHRGLSALVRELQDIVYKATDGTVIL